VILALSLSLCRSGAITAASVNLDEGYTIPELTFEEHEIKMNEALEFVKDMKIGWNLGNTFDANDSRAYNVSEDLLYESMWTGTETTKEMIDKIKEAGFNTVRLPNSWHNHLTNASYTISKAWLDRYQEVVDYVIDNDMYAIINIHHDNELKYYYPDSRHLKSSTAYITAIWKQLAARFKNYDEKLIFECINEPHLKGTTDEWVSVNTENKRQLDALNTVMKLNQIFVDTVRASGGNNASRYLMIPSYNASADNAALPEFILPADKADNRIIVSVHAYTPYGFALASEDYERVTSEFNHLEPNDTREIDAFMKKIYDKYVSNGTPVVIGEFGARDRSSNIQPQVNFYTYYVGKARSYGITCCVWDNNNFATDGENFGLLNRAANTFEYPELIEALVKYS
jgi:endoglucanase